MIIERVEMREIRVPFREPFRTSFGVFEFKPAILVSVWAEGLRGIGECVALPFPGYTEETHATAWHVLSEFVAPHLVGQDLPGPGSFPMVFSKIRGNPMALAAAECAVWDLFCKAQGISLSQAIGGTRPRVAYGKSLGIENDTDRLLEKIQNLIEGGCQKIKIKIAPGYDRDPVAAIRGRFGRELPLMVDANSAYTLADLPALIALDAFGLLMIEQPLAWDDLEEHAVLQQALRTPICLDESIRSAADARRALRLGSARIVNIKIGRVGGLSAACAVHSVCRAAGIPVWCGGMFELGVGRAFNLALASLPGFSLPSDTTPTRSTFDTDILVHALEPECPGWFRVPEAPGIGVDLDVDIVDRLTQNKFSV